MQSDLAAEWDRYSDKYLYLRQLHGGRRVVGGQDTQFCKIFFAKLVEAILGE
jgi:hypothetical protein